MTRQKYCLNQPCNWKNILIMPEIFIDGNVGLHGNPLLFPGPAQFNNDLKDALFFFFNHELSTKFAIVRYWLWMGKITIIRRLVGLALGLECRPSHPGPIHFGVKWSPSWAAVRTFWWLGPSQSSLFMTLGGTANKNIISVWKIGYWRLIHLAQDQLMMIPVTLQEYQEYMDVNRSHLVNLKPGFQ